MLKKSFLAVFGLLLALAFVNPPKARAEVAIGVTIGGPIYARPAYPYGYAYVAPRSAYVYPRSYAYPPVYYGRVYDRPYWRGRNDRHEYYEHRYDRGRYDHDRYDRDRYYRDRR
jgi:hypothetical protein